MRRKLFYKIGEACKLLEIQPYVLRYWETEFPALAPSKSRSGQRVYSEREIEIIRRIKELLYEEGYTIAGAKKKLESELESGLPLAKPEVAPREQVAGVPPDAESEADAGPPAAFDIGAAPLDTHTDERIQTLRRGIGRALDEARTLLAMLDRT